MKVKKTATLPELLETVSETFKYPVNQVRVWPVKPRNNQTFRPTYLDLEIEMEKPLQEIADQDIPWTIFVETTLPDGWASAGPAIGEDTTNQRTITPNALSSRPPTNTTHPSAIPPANAAAPTANLVQRPLPPFDKDSDVLLFFKYFCPVGRTLSYVTHLYCPISLRLRDLFPRLRQLAGLPPQTPLLLYEEVKPTMVEVC